MAKKNGTAVKVAAIVALWSMVVWVFWTGALVIYDSINNPQAQPQEQVLTPEMLQQLYGGGETPVLTPEMLQQLYGENGDNTLTSEMLEELFGWEEDLSNDTLLKNPDTLQIGTPDALQLLNIETESWE